MSTRKKRRRATVGETDLLISRPPPRYRLIQVKNAICDADELTYSGLPLDGMSQFTSKSDCPQFARLRKEAPSKKTRIVDPVTTWCRADIPAFSIYWLRMLVKSERLLPFLKASVTVADDSVILLTANVTFDGYPLRENASEGVTYGFLKVNAVQSNVTQTPHLYATLWRSKSKDNACASVMHHTMDSLAVIEREPFEFGVGAAVKNARMVCFPLSDHCAQTSSFGTVAAKGTYSNMRLMGYKVCISTCCLIDTYTG